MKLRESKELLTHRILVSLLDTSPASVSRITKDVRSNGRAVGQVCYRMNKLGCVEMRGFGTYAITPKGARIIQPWIERVNAWYGAPVTEPDIVEADHEFERSDSIIGKIHYLKTKQEEIAQAKTVDPPVVVDEPQELNWQREYIKLALTLAESVGKK